MIEGGRTCWGWWCSTCQTSRQPRGRAAAHQGSAWVETCLLSSLPPPPRYSQPRSQGSEHSLFEQHPEQDEDDGEGEGDEEVVELGRLGSGLKILPGDVGRQPDCWRPEGGGDGRHWSISETDNKHTMDGRTFNVLNITQGKTGNHLNIRWGRFKGGYIEWGALLSCFVCHMIVGS